MRAASGASVAVAAALAAGCGGGAAPPPPPAYAWRLPAGFAPPPVPADNPMSEEKVELGRRLFHDRSLSVNGRSSCASCHLQHLGFTDGAATSIGATGQQGKRSSPALANLGYARALTWANSVIESLEAQALIPLLGDNPVELGAGDATIDRLAADPDYAARFRAAFPEEARPVTAFTVVKALAAFQRTLLSGDAPYDRFLRGEAGALSAAAQRGLALFQSDRLACSRCHSGFAFSDVMPPPGSPPAPAPFHNTGLYDEDGLGAYPAGDRGLYDLTLDPADMGRFRAPSLRNVAVTAPYMHDGSVPTLAGVVDHYAAGGRSSLSRGGVPSPLRDPLVRGFTLAPGERDDLVAFLESLTDATFLADPRFSNPLGAP